MLEVTIPSLELFDEETESFVTVPEVKLRLEHSLASLARWESKWKKPFLDDNKKTTEETIGYLQAMCLDPVDPEVFRRIPKKIGEQIEDYVSDTMTATWFSDEKKKTPVKTGPTITAELMYYWMASLNIPFECENWHLSRLITLIRVFEAKNAPKKKMSRSEQFAQQRALNEQRRKQFGMS